MFYIGILRGLNCLKYILGRYSFLGTLLSVIFLEFLPSVAEARVPSTIYTSGILSVFYAGKRERVPSPCDGVNSSRCLGRLKTPGSGFKRRVELQGACRSSIGVYGYSICLSFIAVRFGSFYRRGSLLNFRASGLTYTLQTGVSNMSGGPAAIQEQTVVPPVLARQQVEYLRSTPACIFLER